MRRNFENFPWNRYLSTWKVEACACVWKGATFLSSPLKQCEKFHMLFRAATSCFFVIIAFVPWDREMHRILHTNGCRLCARNAYRSLQRFVSEGDLPACGQFLMSWSNARLFGFFKSCSFLFICFRFFINFLWFHKNKTRLRKYFCHGIQKE